MGRGRTLRIATDFGYKPRCPVTSTRDKGENSDQTPITTNVANVAGSECIPYQFFGTAVNGDLCNFLSLRPFTIPPTLCYTTNIEYLCY